MCVQELYMSLISSFPYSFRWPGGGGLCRASHGAADRAAGVGPPDGRRGGREALAGGTPIHHAGFAARGHR